MITKTEFCNGNNDEELNIADALYVLNFLFARGFAMEPPYPECGPNPELEMGLGCVRSVCD